MAHLLRVALAWALAVCGVAHAAYVAPVVKYTNNPPYYYDTAAAFCQSYADYWTQYETQRMGYSVVYTVQTCTPPTTTPGNNGVVAGNKRTTNGSNVSDAPFTGSFSSAYQCPSGSTAGTGADVGKCIVSSNECTQQAGQSAGIWKYDGGYGAQPNSLASEICKKPNAAGQRCIVKVTDPKCDQVRLQGVGNPFWSCRGAAFYTGGYGVGSACDRTPSAGGDGSSSGTLPEVTVSPSPDPLPPGSAGPTDCPPGTFDGTINGTHTCVENIDSPTAGNSPQTGQTSVKNPDGSTTTTTTQGTTTCAQGTCTTVNNISSNITNNPASTCPQGTTPSGPNGSASSCTGTSTNSTTQAQSEFCKANPKDKQCGGSGTGGFAGSCAAGFVATGEDPVLNAMAKEQYTRNCETLRTDTEPSTWVTAEGQKTGNAMDGNPNNGTVNIGPGNFDQSDSLGGGGCSLNKTVVVRGYSVALPFNVLCDPLAVLGQILVAVSLLLAARIVTRG